MNRRDAWLVGLAAVFAWVVITLGAYVRLSDAGLGCPDWPGCYGHLTVPDSAADHARAAQAFPSRPVETHKAWKEMVHRYAAGTLGLLVLAIAVRSWRRETRRRTSPWVPSLLLGVIVFQALLGMWTVTLLLKPVIVTAHLLGGMTTLGLLVGLWSGSSCSSTAPLDGTSAGCRSAVLEPKDRSDSGFGSEPLGGCRRGLWLSRLALAAVAVQIALGGWVSSNYAALACTEFPTCRAGAWVPETDWGHAFHLVRELGQTADGQALPVAALTAIHLVHRAGALMVTLLVTLLAVRLRRQPETRAVGAFLGGVLSLQVGLGVANVWGGLPLPVAVAHNAGAALLMATLVFLNTRLAAAGRLAVQSSAPPPSRADSSPAPL